MENNSFNQKLIQKYFTTQKLPHAFLFKATPKINLETEILYLINFLNNWDLTNLNNNLPYDLLVLDSNEKTIDKNVLENAIYQMSAAALEAKNKILVIKNLENIHVNSLNALLKFLEEPFQHTYIILTTNFFDKVLLTIRSRCQIFNVHHKNLVNTSKLKSNHFDLLQTLVSTQNQLEENISVFDNYLKLINEQLKKALKNPYYFKIFLEQELTKENAFFLLNIIRHLFVLVLSNTYQSELFFDEKIFQKYLNSQIELVQLLTLINQFLKKINSNNNFFLMKEKFLIAFVGCYE